MRANTFAIRRARKLGELVYICLLEGHYVNVTADLFSPFVDLRTVLMFLPFRDDSFVVIHCSHVPNTWPTITRGCGNCAASCETTAGR